MKKTTGVLGFALIAVALSGCAHYHKVEGRQEKSEIPEGVRVAIGSSEVKEGDSVGIFRKECVERNMQTRFGKSRTCTTTKLGQGLVSKVLTSDLAIMNPPQGLVIESDMYVEKDE